MNNCVIIYGYENKIQISDILKKNKNVILIEPTSTYIDEIIGLQKIYKFKLVKKLLIDKNQLSEIKVRIEDKNICIDNLENKGDKDNGNYKNVYTTSLENIIKEYNIDIIENIYINKNVSNLNKLLDKWCSLNYLIKRITLKLINVQMSKNILNNLFFTFYDQHISLKDQDQDQLDFSYMYYINKKIDEQKPNILLYFMSKETNEEVLQYNKFIKHYNVDVVQNETQNCVQKQQQFVYEKISKNLEIIFEEKKEKLENIDIIIQFNKEFIKKKKFMEINFPIKDTILYINKEHDIIYSSKNCMHMLYDILKSEYFTEYIKEQKSKNKLFKIFQKRIFYDYLKTIFKIIEI